MMFFFRIIRLPNLIMVLSVQLIIWFACLAPVLRAAGIQPVLSPLDAVLLALCTVIITAAGYVINDIYDMQTDAVNKPDKQLVGKVISMDTAIHLYYALLLAGGGIAAYLAWRVGHPLYIFIYALFGFKLWYYSHSLQRRPLTGNVLVALLSALFPMLYLLAEEPALQALRVQSPDIYRDLIEVFLLFSAIAFLSSWARELIKDIEDMPGDKLAGYMTLPILAGVPRTVRMVAILLGILALGMAGWGIFSPHPHSLAMSLLLSAGFAGILIKALRCEDKTCFHKISSYLKGIMLLVIVFLWLYISGFI